LARINQPRWLDERQDASMTFHADRHVHVLIIGGGAIGTALAYHLARAGRKDILLVEKAQLTHGCTWHAAGLVGQLRGKKNLTRLMQNSVAVFDRLEQETGQAISWKKVGSLRLAGSKSRWSEIRRSMGQAKSFGVECHALSAAEAKNRFPFISADGIEGAAFIPGDGYIDPYSLAMAYANGARANGVKIEQGVCVESIALDGRRAVGVATNTGTIGCDILVNCAGLWAKRVGRMAGVELAAGIVEHQYFLTEKKLQFDAGLTTLRDPDNNFYLKPDTGSFAIGGWEDGSRGFHRGLPPFSFARELLPPNMDRLELFASRDRPGHRLQAERFGQRGEDAGAFRGTQARRIDGQDLRPRNRCTHGGRDQGALAAARNRRPDRWRVPRQGRPDQSDRYDAGARQGREAAWRAHLREHRGHEDSRRARPGNRRGNARRVYRRRYGCTLRRHVVAQHCA
jgi:glycine/D-amino acid oxidase-like deaminating enzyme